VRTRSLYRPSQKGKEEAGAKYRDYFKYEEPLKVIPPHRALALFRGRNEEMLRVTLKLPEGIAGRRRSEIAEQCRTQDRCAFQCPRSAARRGCVVAANRALDVERQAELGSWNRNCSVNCASVRNRKRFACLQRICAISCSRHPRVRAPSWDSIQAFAPVVKVAIVDRTGKVLETATVYPHAPRNDWNGSIAVLAALGKKHSVELISIGNGTASRETDKLAADLLKLHPDVKATKVVVSEAGASVYSASALASAELPALDVSLRGAVSIARRLQDPLAELVKIDPKSIGVGQYQHDVNQTRLARSLDAIVEDCGERRRRRCKYRITCSARAHLRPVDHACRQHRRVSQPAGRVRLPRCAQESPASRTEDVRASRRIFAHRKWRRSARRIVGASGSLSGSRPNPGRPQRPLKELMGDSSAVRKLDPAKYTDEKFGLPTVKDILKELEKPGRDPRPEFKTASFKDGVEDMKDLAPGMLLEGVVTNVTNFGAFVDIGVHQDASCTSRCLQTSS